MISEKWDKRFIELAKYVSTWSNDVHKVGSVIVDKDNVVLSLGYNGFPRLAVDDLPERRERNVKLIYTVHAEENAILNAARKGISLDGSTIYLEWFPCVNCAKSIINAGIKRVVCCGYDKTDIKRIIDYKFDLSEQLFEECKIKVDIHE